MQERMSEKKLVSLPGNMRDRMPKYMPARMPERMPSEYLSDRMSVVGAIRRKYLFGSGRFHLLQWFHVVAPNLGLDVGAFGHLHRYYFIVGYRDGNLVARDEPDLL